MMRSRLSKGTMIGSGMVKKYWLKRRHHFWNDVLNSLHPRSWRWFDGKPCSSLTHVAYINLESRPDRRESIELQLSTLSVAPLRVAGEYLLSEADFDSRFPELSGRPRSAFLRSFENGPLGYIGCYIGNLRAIQSCPDDKGFSLICEDDLWIRKRHLNLWIGLCSCIEFDIILIDPQGDYKRGDRVARNLYRISEGVPAYWGTHAYLVRNSSKSEIIRRLNESALDSPDHALMDLRANLRVFALRTSLCYPKGSFGTDIKRGASVG